MAKQLIFTKRGFRELEGLIAKTDKEMMRARKEMGVTSSDQDGWHDEVFKAVLVEEQRQRKRLQELKQIASEVKIIEPKEQAEKVDIGNGVVIEWENGSRERFVLDGYLVAGIRGRISIYSPVGRAIWGAKKGETRVFEIGKEKKTVKILDILSPSQN